MTLLQIGRCATNSCRDELSKWTIYLISTFAPAASIFFLISSASCFVTPSFIVLGAPSTGPAATATGAAALTPHFSSSCLTNPAISSTDRLLSCSTNFSVSAILFFPPIAASESFQRITIDSRRSGQFSFFCRATPKCSALPRQAMRLPYKVYVAGAPSFSAFAFSNRASAEAGSFRRRTRRVAEDKNSPSNCACKVSRGGNSANVSNSAVERTARSMKPILTAAILNSVANVLKILATGATSFSPVTIAVWKTGIGHGAFEEIVFDDVHFRPCWRQPAAQLAEIGNLHALVIGHDHKRRAFQLLRQI